MPNAPKYFIWECDGGSVKRFKLIYESGMHYASYISCLSMISSIYLWQKDRLFYSVTILIGLFVMFLNGARLSFLFVFCLFLFCIFKKFRIPSKIFFGLLLILICLFYYSTINITFYDRLFITINNFAEISPIRIYSKDSNQGFLSGREILYKALLEMVKAKPIAGHGYQLPFHKYGIIPIYENGKLIDAKNTGTSESGLLFTARYGIFATIFYLYFIFKPILVNSRNRSDGLTIIEELSVIFALLCFGFNTSLFVSYNISFLLYFFLIQLTQKRRPNKDKNYQNVVMTIN